jgi:transposase-like protein
MEAFKKVALLQEKLKLESEKTEENLDREFKKHMTTYFIHKKKNQKIKPKKEKHVEVI